MRQKESASEFGIPEICETITVTKRGFVQQHPYPTKHVREGYFVWQNEVRAGRP